MKKHHHQERAFISLMLPNALKTLNSLVINGKSQQNDQGMTPPLFVGGYHFPLYLWRDRRAREHIHTYTLLHPNTNTKTCIHRPGLKQQKKKRRRSIMSKHLRNSRSSSKAKDTPASITTTTTTTTTSVPAPSLLCLPVDAYDLILTNIGSTTPPEKLRVTCHGKLLYGTVASSPDYHLYQRARHSLMETCRGLDTLFRLKTTKEVVIH